MTDAIESPCIGICSTAIGDELCLGCFRTFAEISHWLEMPLSERETVLSCLAMRGIWLKIAGLMNARIVAVQGDRASLAITPSFTIRLGLPYRDGDDRLLEVSLHCGKAFLLCISSEDWLTVLWQSFFD